jgi:hypothetical protein
MKQFFGSATFLITLFILAMLAALLLPAGEAALLGGFEIPPAFGAALIGVCRWFFGTHRTNFRSSKR